MITRSFPWVGRFAVSVTALLALVFLITISNTPARQQAETLDPAIERGHKQLGQACGFCHGADATGARGPDLVRSTLVAHDVKGDLIGEVIRRGRPDKGMPAMPMTDAQVSDIAAFLHTRAAEALSSSGLPNVYPVEKLLTGNAEAGKTFFNGPGGCNSCHSPTGDLAKVAQKYSPIELEAHMLYPDGRHTTVVVTLPSGEEIKGPLAQADDFVVSLHDASGWYRSFSRDQVKVELQDPLDAHRELLSKLAQADVHNLFAYVNTLK
jgi:cytochrome c oxidase cbb3-type subunit 3